MLYCGCLWLFLVALYAVHASESCDNDLNTLLIPSLFPHVPPSIRFSYNVTLGNGLRIPTKLQHFLTIRDIKGSSKEYKKQLKQIMRSCGFVSSTSSNIPWFLNFGMRGISTIRNTRQRNAVIMETFQKYNHLPSTTHLAYKDNQCLHMKELIRKSDPVNFPFFLPCYVLPAEWEVFKEEWNNGPKLQLWLVKRPKGSKGDGIYAIRHFSELEGQTAQPVVVNKYISSPYLYDGRRKVEIRTMVLLTSVDPLRIYISYDAFTLISQQNFTSSPSNLSDVCQFVSNLPPCSRRIHDKHEWDNKDVYRLTPTFFNDEFTSDQVKIIENGIEDAVIKAFISIEPILRNSGRRILLNNYNGFQIMAFDFFLGDKLQVYLNEVNGMPIIREGYFEMLTEALTIAGYQLPPTLSNHARSIVLKELTECRGKTRQLDASDVVFDEKLYAFESEEYDNRIIGNGLSVTQLRQLIVAEDELNRVSTKFKRIFPTGKNQGYMEFFGVLSDNSAMYKCYYDWEVKYGSNRRDGIDLLRKYASLKLHK